MQYVGDAVMAVFGAPDPHPGHASSAIRAAIGMHTRQQELDRTWAEQGLAAFGLQVAPEKTAMLVFDGNLLHRNERLAIKPATFTFLGFVHFLTKASAGKINIARSPSTKSRERFLLAVAAWLKMNMHRRVWEQQRT